jgi:hypothetical protein
MQFRRSDLTDLSYFLELAKHRNFRKAGLELSVSASAHSYALRVRRTTRQGAGLFYVADPMVRQDLDTGVLRTEDFDVADEPIFSAATEVSK